MSCQLVVVYTFLIWFGNGKWESVQSESESESEWGWWSQSRSEAGWTCAPKRRRFGKGSGFRAVRDADSVSGVDIGGGTWETEGGSPNLEFSFPFFPYCPKTFTLFCSQPHSSSVFPLIYVSKNDADSKSLYVNLDDNVSHQKERFFLVFHTSGKGSTILLPLL